MTQVIAAGWDQIDAIAHAFFERPRPLHIWRLQYQDQGHGIYLVAWRNEEPMGHLLLKWPGWPERPGATENQARHECSLVEDLWVLPNSRGLGIGRALMESAHSHSSQKGISTVGLGVGLDQGYEPAQHLYRSMGYKDSGLGPFIESSPGWWDILIFLVKELA